jgi:hypothetical protein
VLFLGLLGFTYSRTSVRTQEYTPIWSKLPVKFGNWERRGDRDLQFQKEVYETLEGAHINGRNYVGEYNDNVQLSMIESTYPDSFHNPLFCSEGAGQTKVREEFFEVQAKGGGRKVPVWLYVLSTASGDALLLLSWYNCDGVDTNSLLTMRRMTLFRPFVKQIPPSYVVKMSTSIRGYMRLQSEETRREAENDALEVLKDFCADLIPALDRAVAEARSASASSPKDGVAKK